jgi:hypothetical protein
VLKAFAIARGLLDNFSFIFIVDILLLVFLLLVIVLTIYQLIGSATYSNLHISQLTCVIVTMAIWNNPAMNSQPKMNCIKKKVLLHALLSSSAELKLIKRKK